MEDHEAEEEAMRAIGSRASSADLLFLLHRSENKYIRGISARWLGDRNETSAKEPLLAAMDDPAVYVQANAAVSYARVCGCQFADGLLALFDAPRSSTRFVAIGAALEILDRCEGAATPDVAALVGSIRGLLDDDSADVRRDAIVLLRRLPPEVVAERSTPLLLHCLRDAEPKVRLEAVRALSGNADPRVGDALIALLEDPDRAVVQAAVRALAGSADSPRAQMAVRSMLAHANADFRVSAIEAMVLMGDAEGAQDLSLLLSDRLPRVREAATRAIGRLRPANASMLLTPALHDRASDVRQAAAEMLGALCPRGDADAARALALATADRSRDVARAAIDALQCIRSEEHVDELVQALCRCPHPPLLGSISRLLDSAANAHPGSRCRDWRVWWQAEQRRRQETAEAEIASEGE